MHIKILGTGCANCKKLFQLTEQTVKELAMDAKIEKIETMQDIMKFQLLTLPGLVINEKLILAGKVPAKNELMAIIAKAQAQTGR